MGHELGIIILLKTQMLTGIFVINVYSTINITSLHLAKISNFIFPIVLSLKTSSGP